MITTTSITIGCCSKGKDKKSYVGKVFVLWSAKAFNDTLEVVPVKDAWHGQRVGI
jgi:hypothetical protein